MRKNVLLFNNYLASNYTRLQVEISKKYYLSLDLYHDSIIDVYMQLVNGSKFSQQDIRKMILDAYHRNRNTEISQSYNEMSKEDNILEFINNVNELETTYCNDFTNLKDKVRLLLSKNDFEILDLYFFQNKSKRIICAFTGLSPRELDITIASIKNKLYKKISYENYKTNETAYS